MQDLNKLKVNEIFKSVQGESTLTGFPTIFIRLQECNLRCPWCDTKYSWPEDKGKLMWVEEIMKECDEVGYTGFVCITGGEPLLQKRGVRELADDLRMEDQVVSIETNGGVSIAGLPQVYRMIMDWKGPSAFKGGKGFNDYNSTVLCNLTEMKTRQMQELYHDEVKFLVSNRKDYEFARDAIQHMRNVFRIKVIKGVFSPAVLMSPIIVSGGDNKIVRKLAEWMVADSSLPYMQVMRPRYQLQIHKYIWPMMKRGV